LILYIVIAMMLYSILFYSVLMHNECATMRDLGLSPNQ